MNEILFSRCCIRNKKKRLCTSQVDKQQNPNKIYGWKNQKAKKVATKNEKSHELKELIKNAIHQRRKGSGI